MRFKPIARVCTLVGADSSASLGTAQRRLDVVLEVVLPIFWINLWVSEQDFSYFV